MNGESFFLVAQDLLDCVVDRLNIPTTSPLLTGADLGAPTHQHVAVGEVVWDNCCEAGRNGQIGGQVWVAVDSVYPSKTPPQPNFDLVNCSSTSFVMTATVGLLRCWPTMNSSGQPPPPDALQAASLRALDDVASLIEGIMCCSRLHDYDLIVGASGVTIDGACIGIGLPVTVVLGPCIDCDWTDG